MGKISVIITGVTGMVGEGVLHECLLHSNVEKILVINRKPCGIVHPKLIEIIHQDFFNFEPIKDQLIGYNAAFLCLCSGACSKIIEVALSLIVCI